MTMSNPFIPPSEPDDAGPGDHLEGAFDDAKWTDALPDDVVVTSIDEERMVATVASLPVAAAPSAEVQVPAEPVTPTLAPIPDFEGHAVTQTKLKVSGAASVELYDETVGLDDRLRMVGEYRVVGVAFRVDPKTGETVREQILKPLDLTLCPWDPSDPLDNGIVRAKGGQA